MTNKEWGGEEKRKGSLDAFEKILDAKLEILATKIDANHHSMESSILGHFMLLEKLNKTIYGNGHPENGVVFKVVQNSKFIVFWEKFWGWILTLAVGVPFSVLTAVVIFKLTH